MKNLIDRRIQQQQQQHQQLLAQHQLAQQQLIAQQQLAQQQLMQQQLAQEQQLAMQEKYDTLVSQIINITGGNITINGNSQITCEQVTVTGGNNQIMTTGPMGCECIMGPTGPSGHTGPSGPSGHGGHGGVTGSMGPSGSLGVTGSPPDPASFIGYFQQTYGSSTQSLNIPQASGSEQISVIAFSGFVDPTNTNTLQNPLTLANQQNNLLQGVNKYLTLGGGGYYGDPNSTITNDLLNNVYIPFLNVKKFSTTDGTPYTGIVFDIELIDTSVNKGTITINTLITSFINTFQAAKNNGYTVIVTVGHDGYGSVPALMPAFLSCQYIDYLAPQLYDSGACNNGICDSPVLQTNTVWPNTNWSAWVGAKPKIIPVVSWLPLFTQAQEFFSSLPQPIPLSGVIVWNNATQWLPGQPSPCTGGGGGGSGAPVTINITNSTKESLTIGSTIVNANGGTYNATLNIPFTLVTTFAATDDGKYPANGADIACSTSELDINFAYNNGSALTNIIASGSFNGTQFSVGKTPVSSNKIGTPTATTNTLTITYTDNPPAIL